MTLTTREDVKDSRRNRALLDGIAEAFSDAVEELCDRKTLRYTWMRFLPDDRISSNFWRDLGPKIYASLRTRPILEPFRGNTNISSDTHSKVLEKVGCLYILPDYFLDNVDQPLLRATNEISYMSLNYSFLDRARLRRIGVQILDHIEILKLLKQDLKNYASWWRSLDRSTDWQTKMSQVLIGAWDNPACKAILRNMEIVALKNGTWSVPCGGAKLLFPASGEADIPDDLGLELIHPDNIKNPQRAILMKALLVQQASPKQVVEKIILQHRIARPFNSIDKGVQQFIYLFWHGSAEPQSGSMYELQFSCHAGKFRRASHIVYLPMKDDNLGPQKLFEAINAEPVKAPSYSALFINDCYLYAIDDAVRNDTGQSWTSWLTTTVGILKQPRLYHNVRLVSEITPEFAHIMKHRPDVLIQLLHRYQQHYCPIPDIHIPQFRKTKVLCEMQELICLWKCVLPTTELRKLTKDLGLQRFPFLQLDRDIEMIDLHQWSFAQKLGVLTTDSLSFYVMCLKLVHRVLEADPTTAALQILTKIQDKCFPKNRVWLR